MRTSLAENLVIDEMAEFLKSHGYRKVWMVSANDDILRMKQEDYEVEIVEIHKNTGVWEYIRLNQNKRVEVYVGVCAIELIKFLN
jgi:hypothetical protein